MVDFSKVTVDFPDIILQKFCDKFLLHLYNRNINLQLLHKAVIGLHCSF